MTPRATFTTSPRRPTCSTSFRRMTSISTCCPRTGGAPSHAPASRAPRSAPGGGDTRRSCGGSGSCPSPRCSAGARCSSCSRPARSCPCRSSSSCAGLPPAPVGAACAIPAAAFPSVPSGLFAPSLERDVVVGAGRVEVRLVRGHVARGDVLALRAGLALAALRVEELHLERDDLDLGALRPVLGLPGGPVEPPVDADAASLGEVHAEHLGLVSEHLHVEEVPLAHPAGGPC